MAETGYEDFDNSLKPPSGQMWLPLWTVCGGVCLWCNGMCPLSHSKRMKKEMVERGEETKYMVYFDGKTRLRIEYKVTFKRFQPTIWR